MTRYIVDVKGCDGDTYIAVDLTDEEAATVRRIAGLTQETSEYGCEPVINLYRYDDPVARYARETIEDRE